MKKTTRYLALCLAVLMFLSVGVVGARAANTANRSFDCHIDGDDFSYIYDVAGKTDESAIYLWVSGASNLFTFVQALGSESEEFSSYALSDSLTLVQGMLVDYVCCRMSIDYSVHNYIKEYGYDYATLAFMAIGDYSTTITGLWSPDSSGSYAEPS